MAGIMEMMFGKKPDTSVNPMTQKPTPGNVTEGTGITNNGTEGTAPNGVTPKGDEGAAGNKSPFAEFENLWQAPTTADGKPVPTQEPLYKVDPQEIMKIAGQTDFKSVVTKEMIGNMAKGGQEGIEAMMEAMQKMSQLVYANAAVAATKIAESGITKARSQFEAQLPNVLKNQNLSESLKQKNPALSNPAVAPLVDAVRAQLAQKYPNATTAELQSQAEAYFLAAAGAFNPDTNKIVEEVVPKSEDWETYFKL